jgi:hypothetical protein
MPNQPITVTPKELSERYGYGINYYRNILCRPEFNQFLSGLGKFVYFDSDNFNKMVKFVIKMKENKYTNWRKLRVTLVILLIGCSVNADQYTTTRIYSPSGTYYGYIRIDKNTENSRMYDSHGGYHGYTHNNTVYSQDGMPLYKKIVQPDDMKNKKTW